MFTSPIHRFETLRVMCTKEQNKHHVFKVNDFHWLFTILVYQQKENSERANQIHRFTKDRCKFILIAISTAKSGTAMFHCNLTKTRNAT